ncbi:MAG: uroporphyrinogen-III C-methyltransferase [Bacteroidota bacterium]
MKPKLTLVGAGPGDPELISIKGVKALQEADVILYDALVHPELLTYAKPECSCTYVGKRAGHHSMKQGEINRLIVSSAFSHGHVVRLKGGDPFIFGRGHEEMEYAQSFGIEVAVVPGISSVTAIPATQEIPLTRRGISESFWVVTATTKTGELSRDLALAAQSTASIVILMGMRKLSEIVALFKENGKSDQPIMIVQRGTMEDEKVCIATIADIEEKARIHRMGTPALILIGDIVALHRQYQRYAPLAFAS